MQARLSKKIRRETVIEIVFLVFLFCFYFMWAWIQPLDASPDEKMRYQVAQFIFENGRLPVGYDEAVRDALWGISYAFSPILDYILGAAVMKLVSLFSTASFSLLMGARMISILSGVGTGFFTLRISKKLFSREKAWLLTAFVTMLPGAVFLSSYVNSDALALFASSIIIYMWLCGMENGWNYKTCIGLGIGLSICALAYYNAYGFILFSIFLFGLTLLLDSYRRKDYKNFIKKGLVVVILVLLLIGWWFIRSYILYDGDIFGRAASAACAEQYAQPGFKPSDHITPSNSGMNIWQMLWQKFEGYTDVSWVELVSRSFVGRFGNIDILMPTWLENFYMNFIEFGCLLVLLHPVKTFRVKDQNGISKQGIFNWCMLASMITPVILTARYSFVSDYQPQGRYCMPMLLPLAYFIITGYGYVFDEVIKNEKIRRATYAVFASLLVVLCVYVYMTVFWPEYGHGAPFSPGAFFALPFSR